MGVLQRFERRLGGLVEGTFARVFGGHVQPVEVAAALQREAGDKKAIVGEGRVLVPNAYVVELGKADSDRLGEYDAALRKELAAMVTEHAQEQGWSFVGPVTVGIETVEDLDTGLFRVRSSVQAPDDLLPKRPLAAQEDAPRLVLPASPENPVERVVPLAARVTVLGRSSEADVRLSDTGVSRLHAEVRREGDVVSVVDLGSTNGTTVNGRRVGEARLEDGDVVQVGTRTLVFRTGT